MKVTQWFSCEEKPSRVGDYQFRIKRITRGVGAGPTLPMHFDGADYRLMTSFKIRSMSKPVDCRLNNAPSEYEWRGLAEKPKAKK